MATIKDRIRCGECGCDTVRLVNVRDSKADRHTIQRLELHCTKCPTVSVLEVSPVTITLEGKKNSPGSHCGGWE